MRVKLKKRKFYGIGNHISVKEGQGNFIGIAKFSNTGSYVLKKYLTINKKNLKDYYTIVLIKWLRMEKK